MVVKRNAWENNSSPDSNKNLKTSESQTDSVKHDSKFHHGNSRIKYVLCVFILSLQRVQHLNKFTTINVWMFLASTIIFQ
jgi:hypothetical protein